MTPRLSAFADAPKLMQQFLAYSTAVNESGLEKSLCELVKIRASQINGCANCLNMHTADARKSGETEQRLYLLSAWHEAPCYSERERAALAWTDHLTEVAQKRAPDDIYAMVDAQFSKEEQVQLALLITVINSWNRLAVAFHLYDPSLGWQ